MSASVVIRSAQTVAVSRTRLPKVVLNRPTNSAGIIVLPPTGGGGQISWSPPSASAVWMIPHNLNRFPTVTYVDPGGNVSQADIDYLDSNVLTMTFAVAVSGTAYIN